MLCVRLSFTCNFTKRSFFNRVDTSKNHASTPRYPMHFVNSERAGACVKNLDKAML